jgi:hypothetical protein
MSAASSGDPFTGPWTLNPSKSALSFPAPRFWLQHVQSNAHELILREDIVLEDGTEFTVSLQAGFDGKDYPVAGSRYVGTMAYTRPELRTILGLGKQNGSITLRDTVDLQLNANLVSARIGLDRTHAHPLRRTLRVPSRSFS